MLKVKHLLKQKRKFPHCWLRYTDKTRQDTADGAKQQGEGLLVTLRNVIAMNNVQALNIRI